MPPKAKAAAAADEAAKAAAAAAASKATEAAAAVAQSSSASSATTGRSLWEKACDETVAAGKPAKQRTASNKTIDDIVDKSLYDNFRNFTSSEVDGTIIDGKTLRQQLQEGKRLHRIDPKNNSMGNRYYQNLREMYASTESPAKRLV
eukprot:10994308-Heterocapsa_arctica.AAC.1